MTFRQLAALTIVLTCSAAARADDAKVDNLDGVWLPATADFAGKPFPEQIRKSIKLEIKGDVYNVTIGANSDRGTCKLNASASPKTINIIGGEGPNKGKTILAIYERKGDTLKICYDLAGKERPTEFKSTEGSQLFLVEYKLQK